MRVAYYLFCVSCLAILLFPVQQLVSARSLNKRQSPKAGETESTQQLEVLEPLLEPLQVRKLRVFFHKDALQYFT
jgi:hypothetical protein